MPRPKRPGVTIDAPEVNEAAVAQAHEAAHAMAVVDGAAAELALRHGETFQMIGAANAAAGIAQILDAARVRTFMRFRDEKLYVGLPYRDEQGALRVASTLEEATPQFFGVGYEAMRQRVQQFEALGEAGFNGAMRAGLTFKQLRALQGTDAETRQKAAAALERGSRAEVLDLIEELMEVRDERERELCEEKARCEAKDKLLIAKNKKIDELDAGRQQSQPWEREVGDGVKEIDEIFSELSKWAFRAAELAEKIPGLQFEGLDDRTETRRQRAVLANKYFDAEQHFLHQAVGRMLVVRDQGLIKLVEAERYQLPEGAIGGGE